MIALRSLTARSERLRYAGSDKITAVDLKSRSRLRSSTWHSRMSTPELGMSRSRSYLDTATPLTPTISPSFHTDSLLCLRATRNLLPIFISHLHVAAWEKFQIQHTNSSHERLTAVSYTHLTLQTIYSV